MKKVVCMGVFFCVCFGFFTQMVAAEQAEIQIQKMEDREKATIPNTQVPEQSPKDIRPLKELKAIEKTTVEVGEGSSHLIGKSADKTVNTVQKVGDSLFSRFFKAIDFTKKKTSEPNQKGSKNHG